MLSYSRVADVTAISRGINIATIELSLTQRTPTLRRPMPLFNVACEYIHFRVQGGRGF
jgi:hypothetical protein